jgi:hypothetical protein
MTKMRSVRSKRRQKNQKVRRSLPGFQKFLEKRMETTRDSLERATGTDGESLATSLPDGLIAQLGASTTSAHLLSDDSAAEIVRTRAQRVIVHNADAATTAMLTDTLTQQPTAPKSKSKSKSKSESKPASSSATTSTARSNNNVPLTHMSKSEKRAELREAKKPAKKKDLRV